MEVLEEVALEERIQHNVLGCSDCYVDPHNSHMTYCPLSVYNPFHPSHMCLAGAPCSCYRYLVDSCQGHSTHDAPSELKTCKSS